MSDKQPLDLEIFRAYHFKDIYQCLQTYFSAHPHCLPENKQARILLKPNCNANMNALTGNTTDLRIVNALVHLLKDLGYMNVILAEGTNSGFYRNQISVMNRLRLDRLAKLHQIELRDLNYASGQAISFENDSHAYIATDCLDAEFLINLPKMKTHFEAGMSVCLKNLMGCLVGQDNKKKAHADLAANILHLNEHIQPDLHIVDGLVAMEGLGPTRGRPKLMDLLIVGNNPFFCDLVCTYLAGFHESSVSTLALACEQGLITQEMINRVHELKIQDLTSPFAPPKAGWLASFIHHPQRQKHFLRIRNTSLFTYLAGTTWFGTLLFLTGLRQDVFNKAEMDFQGLKYDQEQCMDCGLCKMFCPLGLDPHQVFTKKTKDECLDCLYCYLVCPNKAFAFYGNLGFLEEQVRQYDHIVRSFHTHYNKQVFCNPQF